MTTPAGGRVSVPARGWSRGQSTWAGVRGRDWVARDVSGNQRRMACRLCAEYENIDSRQQEIVMGSVLWQIGERLLFRKFGWKR